MYYLDAAGAPVITLTPETFTNQAGKAVQLADFSLPTADRLALGIWTLESDDLPDPTQAVVTATTYEKQPVAAGHEPRSTAATRPPAARVAWVTTPKLGRGRGIPLRFVGRRTGALEAEGAG